mgnify:CR=1 FL=1
MNNLNIPLYRAEVRDNKFHREDIEIFTELIDGKRYAIGLLCTKGRQIEVTKGDITTFINIDNLTLAINFYDMQDSQGNKIFASLREDGKGGDITELQVSSGTCLSCGDKLPKTLAVAIYEEMEFREIELNPHKCFTKREHNYVLIGNLEYKKVIGIQK